MKKKIGKYSDLVLHSTNLSLTLILYLPSIQVHLILKVDFALEDLIIYLPVASNGSNLVVAGISSYLLDVCDVH